MTDQNNNSKPESLTNLTAEVFRDWSSRLTKASEEVQRVSRELGNMVARLNELKMSDPSTAQPKVKG